MATKKLTLGQQIKAAREKKGLSRPELGYKIGKSHEYLKYIEDDVRPPRRFDRLNIEKELGFKIID
jgi:ribosome-binding protein aMBF1 (putative translation factor)